MASLWAGIVHDSLTPALAAFFPKDAYVQLKAIGSAGSDWTDRLVHDYRLDVAAAHAMRKDYGDVVEVMQGLRSDTRIVVLDDEDRCVAESNLSIRPVGASMLSFIVMFGNDELGRIRGHFDDGRLTHIERKKASDPHALPIAPTSIWEFIHEKLRTDPQYRIRFRSALVFASIMVAIFLYFGLAPEGFHDFLDLTEPVRHWIHTIYTWRP
jgi:hypothetical protein